MMTCTKCRCQFCWLCRDLWSTHNNHFRCAKFPDGALQNKPIFYDDKNEIMLNEGTQYLYYVEKYLIFNQILAYEVDIKNKIKALIPKIKEQNSTFDTDILYDALEELNILRSMIKNIYVTLALENDPKNLTKLCSIQSILMFVAEKIAQVLEKDLNEVYIQQPEWHMPLKNLIKVSKNSVENVFLELDNEKSIEENAFKEMGTFLSTLVK